MAENQEPTVQSLRELAQLRGLTLTEAEAASLLNGVRRNLAMAATVRKLLSPGVEPSPTFSASGLPESQA